VDGLNARLAAEGVALEIRAGAEIAMTRLIDIAPAELLRLHLAGGPWLLVEPPFTPAVAGLDSILLDLQRQGHRILLAHPERCHAFHRDPGMLKSLVRAGVLTSITPGSLVGRFGGEVRRFALSLARGSLNMKKHSRRAPDRQASAPTVARACNLPRPKVMKVLRNIRSGTRFNRASPVANGASSDPGVTNGTPLTTRHRKDIQGLRAIAVLLVVLNHAGIRFLQGGYIGVDVFFVLSGYLITGLLVSKAEKASDTRSYFADFYARRARRILPAATLTLVVTILAAASVLNIARAHQVMVDSISATFFVANFHFAAVGTNYFAHLLPPSPVQQFWSLSVEEQFYLVWPLLVALALLVLGLRRRRQWGPEPVSTRGFGALRIGAVVITIGSLLYAIHDTHQSPTAAYFSTFGRAWELGLGAVLALTVGWVARLPSILLALIGWVGLAAILVASNLYATSTLVPGLPAVLPTVGAAAVIAAGLRADQSRAALSRVLSLRPFGYVGDRSYTFYLWHWPVLILGAEYAGHSLSLTTNLILLVCAFLVSAITYAFFENPIRIAPRVQGSVALAFWPTTIFIVLVVSSIHWSDYQNALNLARSQAYRPPESLKEAEVSPASEREPSHTGWRPSSQTALIRAVAAVNNARPIPSPLVPPALELQSAHYSVPAGCSAAEEAETPSSVCSLGDTSSRRTLVILGDSHAQMWIPAIVQFAQRRGYDVRPMLKQGCRVLRWAGPEQQRHCARWYKWAVAEVHALHPALVMVGTYYNLVPVVADPEYPLDLKNMAAFGAAIRSSAGRVVVIGDPPTQEAEPANCLLSAHATMKECSVAERPEDAEITAKMESVVASFGVFLDTVPWICYEQVCPMVVGHSIVYGDQDHLTKSYTEALAPLFTSALERLLHGDGQVRHPTTRTTAVACRSSGSGHAGTPHSKSGSSKIRTGGRC